MISVVVPCHNCERTFDRCIKSIRNQTQHKLEIVLVDDGSVDGTGALCDKAAEEDTRVKVIHQKNGGLVNAWKRGVAEASGEYIGFCDSDDYLDLELVETLEKKIKICEADIILYGMKKEYDNGDLVYLDNRLEEGLYSREEIARQILPSYFSDGTMESKIIVISRCTNLYRREILMNNFDYVDDGLLLGEDDVTTFAAILSAKSLYCMKGFCPYHYIYNNESKTGKYDESRFQKYLHLREQLNYVARIYNYTYTEQIDADFLSNVLLCMKKEICRNTEGYGDVCRHLKGMRENSVLNEIIKHSDIGRYEWKSKIFAYLILKKKYLLVYVITKTVDVLGVGKP